MGRYFAQVWVTYPVDRLLWDNPEFPHGQHHALRTFYEILVDDVSVVCPLLVREAALVNDLHLFHNCRLARLPRP